MRERSIGEIGGDKSVMMGFLGISGAAVEKIYSIGDEFLALASVSSGHTVLTILKGIFDCYTPEEGMDWGTAIALGVMSLLLGVSIEMTVRCDLGYVVDAFT